MAARVCVGCGLTTDDDGNLVIDNGDIAWPYSTITTCTRSQMENVYCDPATGRLHGEAKHTSSNTLDTTDAQVAAIGANALGGNGGLASLGQVDGLRRTTTYNDIAIPQAQTDIDAFTVPLQNPSGCREARAFITVDFEVEIDLAAGSRVAMLINTDKVWDFRNRTGNTIEGLTWQQSRSYVVKLAPGQLLNFSRTIQLREVSGDGSTYHRSQWVMNYHITTV